MAVVPLAHDFPHRPSTEHATTHGPENDLMKCVMELLAVVVLAGTSSLLSAQERHLSTEATITGTDATVHITTTSKPGELAMTLRGKKKTLVRLPDDAWRITELRACEWKNYGIAMAIETCSDDESRYKYYWATVRFDSKKSSFHLPVVADFLDSKRNRDIVGIVSSGGESIYVVVGKHYHDLGRVGAYVFVHRTPFWPRGGQLHQMTSEPIKRPQLDGR